MFETLKNLIFPLRCPVCDRPGCLKCTEKLHFLDNSACPLCGGLNCRCRGRLCDGYFILSLYDETMRSCVVRMKYGNRPGYAVWFAQQLAHTLTERNHPPFDLIAHVPFFWRDMLQRDYNASRLLAHNLSRITGIPQGAGALRKVRKTEKQHELDAARRRENLKDCFRASGVGGKHILLCDDVITTGSTANECARALKQAGAASVWIAAVAASYRHQRFV